MTRESACLDGVVDLLSSAERAVVLTGAGISTESGIPDFRSPGGVWSKYRTVYYDEFLASAEARQEYWRQKCEAHHDFASAEPNVGHRVLARWEQHGLLRGIITQNIDGLHELAGSRDILELHGTARAAVCTNQANCGQRYNDIDRLVAEFQTTNRVPSCEACGAPLKHATISFGQALPQAVLAEATRWSEAADVFLAIGSSLVVTPAADLPAYAHQCSAKLVILNRDPTPLDRLAEFVVRGGLGKTLSAIDQDLGLGSE